MCTFADYGCIDLLEDPLTRLVMKSDGVSEQEIAELMERVRALLSARRKRGPRTGPTRSAASRRQMGARQSPPAVP